MGNYAGGSLFLYPWLKTPDGRPARIAQLSQYQAFLPGPIPANPLPNFGAPLDEQLCTYALQAPSQDFIGFAVDVPLSSRGDLSWYSTVDSVAGQTVGVDWSSSNLNGPWFGGSQAIPADDDVRRRSMAKADCCRPAAGRDHGLLTQAGGTLYRRQSDGTQ